MSKSDIADRTPPSPGPESSPFKAFLRERWAGLLVSAILGYLTAVVLQSADWPLWATRYFYPIWAVRNFPDFAWIPLAAILFALGLLFDWVFERLTENNYKSLLVGRYLRRRRIAWVSLIAVMLCTTLVLVVISVMGGWLKMAKKSFRGLSGDIAIETGTLRGFPFYEQIIEAIKKDPTCQVEAAIPSIETGGLINFGKGPVFARVMGIPIDEMASVTGFDDSLYEQHTHIVDRLKDPSLPPEERARLERKLKNPPSFDLLNEASTPLSALPAGLTYAPVDESDVPRGKLKLVGFSALGFDLFTDLGVPPELKGKLRYDAVRHNLIFSGRMQPEWRQWLKLVSPDPEYQKAIDILYQQSQTTLVYKGVTGRFNGLIVGNGVIGIRRDKNWTWQRPPWEFEQPTTLTLLDLSNERVDQQSIVTRNFFIVDDSHLGVWQYDQSYVYVAFDLLQKYLNMSAQQETKDGITYTQPARVTDIHVRVRPGVDPNDEAQLTKIRDRIQVVVRKTMQDEVDAHPILADQKIYAPFVETWQEKQKVWIGAIENEKSMLVILFGLISVVAVFLIFCIFYMVVAEKTKDIGIIKSEGATSVGVAAIFLGYGLVIGIIGSGMGFLLSYLILRNINELHTLLARKLGVLVWNPEVYVFDRIPDSMSGADVAVILPIAVLASVLGALLPAIFAGRKNPVEALRWE